MCSIKALAQLTHCTVPCLDPSPHLLRSPQTAAIRLVEYQLGRYPLCVAFLHSQPISYAPPHPSCLVHTYFFVSLPACVYEMLHYYTAISSAYFYRPPRQLSFCIQPYQCSSLLPFVLGFSVNAALHLYETVSQLQSGLYLPAHLHSTCTPVSILSQGDALTMIRHDTDPSHATAAQDTIVMFCITTISSCLTKFCQHSLRFPKHFCRVIVLLTL